jgi:hypothetical protein
LGLCERDHRGKPDTHDTHGNPFHESGDGKNTKARSDQRVRAFERLRSCDRSKSGHPTIAGKHGSGTEAPEGATTTTGVPTGWMIHFNHSVFFFGASGG